MLIERENTANFWLRLILIRIKEQNIISQHRFSVLLIYEIVNLIKASFPLHDL